MSIKQIATALAFAVAGAYILGVANAKFGPFPGLRA